MTRSPDAGFPSNDGALALLEPLLRPLLVVAVVALVLLAFLYLTQRHMIYFPGSAAPDPALLPRAPKPSSCTPPTASV